MPVLVLGHARCVGVAVAVHGAVGVHVHVVVLNRLADDPRARLGLRVLAALAVFAHNKNTPIRIKPK